MPLKPPLQELDELHSQNTARFGRELAKIQLARLAGDHERAQLLTERLGKQIGRALAAADLLGRRRFLLELQARGIKLPPSERLPDDTPLLFAATPKVPFLEAIEDLLGRHPVLAEGFEAMRDAWARRGFAVARSASVRVTGQVQRSVLRFLQQHRNVSTDDAVNNVRKALASKDPGGPGGYTRAYAETVFRTTTSSAYQAGRRSQASRPAVREVASGWRYQATLDDDVRDNHKRGDNFVAHTDDPVWRDHAPPLGYQCRCTLELVTTEEMERRGLSDSDGNMLRQVTAPAGFRKDPGFS